MTGKAHDFGRPQSMFGTMTFYGPTDPVVAGHGLVFTAGATAPNPDPNPQLWAVGADGAVAAVTTPPVATLVPGSATSDGTFAVQYTDPSGFEPLRGNGAISVTATSTPIDLGGEADTGGSDTFTNFEGDVDPYNPVKLISTQLTDGGRTLTATYTYPVEPNTRYTVSTTGTGAIDGAGNPIGASVIGTIAGPDVAWTSGKGGRLTSDAVGGQVVGTAHHARVALALGSLPNVKRVNVNLYLSNVDGVPVTSDPCVASSSHANRNGITSIPYTVPATLAPGTYRLTAVIYAGNASWILEGPTVTESTAMIDAGLTPVGRAPVLRPGRRVVVRVRVTNHGNTTAVGSVAVAIGASGLSFGSAERPVRIRPAGSIIVAIPLALPADLTDDAVTATLTPDAAWEDVVTDDKTVSLATAFG